jgi:hypothetical protein
MTAALGAWIVAWGDTITKVLEEDREWGTTTMRPRLLTWQSSRITQPSPGLVRRGFRCLTSGSLRCERRRPDQRAGR